MRHLYVSVAHEMQAD